MKLTATQLRQAGFDENTVLQFIETQRPIMILFYIRIYFLM